MAEPKRNNSNDKIQQAYDDIHNRTATGSKARGHDDNADLYERENKPDDYSGEPLAPSEQAAHDGIDSSSQTGFDYESSGNDNAPSRGRLVKITAQAVSGNRKWGWIGGGIVGLIVAGFLFLFPVLGPLHIFNNLFDHNFELNDSYRRHRTVRVLRSIFSANDTNRNLNDTPFKLRADLVDFEKFEGRMRSKGWDFQYNSDNKPIGLIRPDGTRASFDDPDVRVRAEIDALVKDTIPAWRMNKRVRTRNLISTFTGPRRSFSWSKLFGRDKSTEPNFESAKFKKQAGLDDIDIDGKVTVRDLRSEDGATSPIERSMEATVEAKLDGATNTEAINAGVSEARRSATPDGGKTSIIFGSVVLGCIAFSVNENQVVAQYEKYASALRYGATFMLAVNEMQQGGDISVGEVGELFGDFNNYEPTTITTNDLNETTVNGEVAYEESDETTEVEYDNNNGSFAEAAAWQRATGAEPTGHELNEEFRVNPTVSPLDMVGGIMGALSFIGGTLSNIPFFEQVCDLLEGGIGFLVGIAFDVIEGIVSVASCLTGVGCVALGKFAIVELLWEVGSRMISAAMTGFVGFLTDNPMQSLAILDQSLNLMASEENRTATPVSSEEYNAQLAVFKQEQNANRSLAERYFDMNNPRSLVASLANFKMKMQNGDKHPGSLLALLLSLPSNSVAGLINSQNVYAQADLDFDNYGFQKYSFDNQYLDMDPFTNAEEVIELIEDDDSIALFNDNGEYARDFAVMCMGYNPDSGEVIKDSSNRNFLPMYSDSEAIGVKAARDRNDLFQSVCIEEASQNADLYSKVGRFVDDMELIQSMQELSLMQAL